MTNGLQSGPPRPSSSGLRAGVDLGGTKIQVAIIDSDGEIVRQCRTLTPHDRGPDGVIDAIVRAIGEVAVDPTSLIGVGVGSPGQIDQASGSVSNAGNLPQWSGVVPLGPRLSAALGVPVRVANDVQVAVMAESGLGAGRSFTSMIGVFCGTGVGGGIVLDGRLWRGRGAAGEIGHVVVKPDGAACTCGKRGCMEAYAGRAAMELKARRLVAKGKKTELFAIMQDEGYTTLAGEVWAKALQHGDSMAIKLIRRAEWALGVAIASAVNLLDVEAVIIGGGLGLQLGQPFIEEISAQMLPNLLQPSKPPTLVLAALGDLSGAIGAGLLVD